MDRARYWREVSSKETTPAGRALSKSQGPCRGDSVAVDPCAIKNVAASLPEQHGSDRRKQTRGRRTASKLA